MFRQICARSLSTTYRAAVVASRPSFKRYAIPQLSVNLREIHATSSKNKEKQEEPLPPTLIEQYKLDQPSRWVPLLLGSFGLASATGTIYSQGGEAIGKFFDETSDAILKEQLAVEEAQIKAVKTALEAHQKQAGIYGNIKEIIEAQKEIIDEIGEAAQMRLKHEVRDNFVRKLDTVVDMQNKVNSSVREALINNATMAVRESFISGDPKLKEDALTNALAAIQNPEAQKDSVGSLYTAHFSAFRKKVEDAKGQEFELNDDDYEDVCDTVRTVARRDDLDPITPNKKMVLDA